MHAIGNDLLIFLLTANQYNKFAYINEKLSFFRAHKDSISIQSKDGKVQLYYGLAAAYFIEHYRPDLISKMNTNIWYLLTIYKTSASKYNFNEIGDFYINNSHFTINNLFLLNKIYKILLRKLGL